MSRIRFYLSPPADITGVIITNARPEVLAVVIPVHLRLGMKNLRIFYDGHLPQKWISRFEARRGVTITPLSHVPELSDMNDFNDLQRAVYNFAYRHCSTEWLAVCDIDEFFVGDEPLAHFLAKVPADRFYIKAETCETVWRTRDDASISFSAPMARRAMPDEERNEAYLSAFAGTLPFLNAAGLVSHQLGKYLIRRGTDAVLNIHTAGPALLVGPGTHESRLHLIHYDAISHRQWRHKLGQKSPRRITRRKSRRKQFETFDKAGKSERRALFNSLYVLDEHQEALLVSQGSLWTLPRFWTGRWHQFDLPTAMPIFAGGLERLRKKLQARLQRFRRKNRFYKPPA